MSSSFLSVCLCCGSAKLKLVLDLGMQPPANSYGVSSTEQISKYPLGLNLCESCWHAQLTYRVDRREIFDNYAYVSGTSNTLNRFFKWFSVALAKQLPANARVLEIAANDGSLIREMQAVGICCVGIDPAKNIVAKAQAEGLPVLCGYWPSAVNEISDKYDAIVCMNVLAHVEDPKSFIAACREKLKLDGVLLIQTSQARMFGNHEFDTCYHEHLSFFNTRSMAVLAESVGLALADTAIVKIHGDSPIFMLRHSESHTVKNFHGDFREGEFGIMESLFEYETQIRLYEWPTYLAFSTHAKSVVKSFKEEVSRRRESGFEIVFVGAAAKAMTVVNACNISPDKFIDENKLKIGLYAPGIGTLIEGLTVCHQLRKPTLFVITAWNFREELEAKIRAIGVPKGSIFYSYYDRLEIHRGLSVQMDRAISQG